MVRKKEKSQAFQQFSSMMIFVIIAALLWLLIKLSSNYTVTEPLTIEIKDTPADLVLTNGTQKIKVTLSTSGFELLNYYFKPKSRRKVDISLEEVPLQKDSESTYSFGSTYAKEKVANFLTLEPKEVSFDENRIILNMEQLDSVKVKVIPNFDITYEKQYNRLGKMQLTPDSVIIYGPKNKISEIDNIYTQNLTLRNVNRNINQDIPLKLDETLNANHKDINVKIFVEKYTETIAIVPITNNSKENLRLFPDKVKIKYIVTLTDYNITKESSFKVNIDTIDINPENNYLPIYLTDYPTNTKIISIEPKEVEYIIIEKNEN